MKLVISIVHDEDVQKLTTALNRANFYVTKLASTGGFLRIGNTTIFVGCDEEKLDTVLGIIKDKCQTTKQMTIANQPYTTTAEGYVPYPIEVTSGGATVFVVDVDQFHKF